MCLFLVIKTQQLSLTGHQASDYYYQETLHFGSSKILVTLEWAETIV